MDRAHPRVSAPGGRHCGFLVSVPPGETIAGMAAYVVIVVDSIYAKRFIRYSTGPRLTSPGVWSSVHYWATSAPDVSRPHPSSDTCPRDRGGVCARVFPSRPHNVP